MNAAPNDHRVSEWILIDVGSVQSIRMVSQTHPPADGQPPRFRIDTADGHGFPYRLQYLGSGTPGQSVAVFPRAVWLVSELRIGY